MRLKNLSSFLLTVLVAGSFSIMTVDNSFAVTIKKKATKNQAAAKKKAAKKQAARKLKNKRGLLGVRVTSEFRDPYAWTASSYVPTETPTEPLASAPIRGPLNIVATAPFEPVTFFVPFDQAQSYCRDAATFYSNTALYDQCSAQGAGYPQLSNLSVVTCDYVNLGLFYYYGTYTNRVTFTGTVSAPCRKDAPYRE